MGSSLSLDLIIAMCEEGGGLGLEIQALACIAILPTFTTPT